MNARKTFSSLVLHAAMALGAVLTLLTATPATAQDARVHFHHGHDHANAAGAPVNPSALLVTQPGAPQAAAPRVIHRWAQEHLIDDSPMPTTPFLEDLTPGYVVVEGDIQIPLEEYLVRVLNIPDGVFGGIGISFWPNGIVPFDFVTSGTGAVTQANRDRAVAAMDVIETFAGVTFRAATGSENRIRFQASTFNNSPIGMRGGTQIINIASWTNQIIIIHEIFHSLGIWHEQSRADRATYITVNYDNICGSGVSNACTAGTGTGQCCGCQSSGGTCVSCAFNFDIVVGASIWGPYNFDSLMHYGPTAFSCNQLPTITVRPGFNGANMGQRSFVSRLDAATVRAIYPFASDRWVDRTALLPGTGAFSFPYWDFAQAAQSAPIGGTVLFKATGNYSAVGTWSRRVRYESPGGLVRLGN
jgi:hypothetical protein